MYTFTGPTLVPAQHSVWMYVKEEPMRGIVAALVLARGFLTAMAPATLAKAVTYTDTFQ